MMYVPTPLFPLPWREDLAADRWAAGATRDRVLVNGDPFHPNSPARKYFKMRARWKADRAAKGPNVPALELDARYCEISVRALLSAHIALFGDRAEPAGLDHLEYHLMSRANSCALGAVSRWLSALLADCDATIEQLEEFTPRRYLAEMCSLFDVAHPYAHLDQIGADQAKRDGLL